MHGAVFRACQVQKYVGKTRQTVTIKDFVRLMMMLDSAKDGEFGLELFFNALCDSYFLRVMEDCGRPLFVAPKYRGVGVFLRRR